MMCRSACMRVDLDVDRGIIFKLNLTERVGLGMDSNNSRKLNDGLLRTS
jgi:hypothetical protein